MQLKLYKNYINNLSKIFKKIGININTVPVLDVLRKKKLTKLLEIEVFQIIQIIVKKLGKICKEYNIN